MRSSSSMDMIFFIKYSGLCCRFGALQGQLPVHEPSHAQHP